MINVIKPGVKTPVAIVDTVQEAQCHVFLYEEEGFYFLIQDGLLIATLERLAQDVVIR